MEQNISLSEALERAKQQLAQVTGLKPMTVTCAYKDENCWHVEIEMLELSRIPSSTDLLGKYEVIMDGGCCAMLRFDRKGTRLRGEPIQEGQSGGTRGLHS